MSVWLIPMPQMPINTKATSMPGRYSIYEDRGRSWQHRLAYCGSLTLSTQSLLKMPIVDNESSVRGPMTYYAFGTRTSRGWPLLCLTGTVISEKELSPSQMWSTEVSGFLVLDKPRDSIGRWPFYPIWWGLFGNTAFYGIAWLAGVVTARRVARATRSFLRFRRGNCHNCNYSLIGLPPNTPCPECGTMPKPRKKKDPP